MQNLNQVTLVGRVGNDPDGHQVNDSMVCRLSVATNRTWKDHSGERKEATTWHRVIAWGKTAEAVQSYCKKGMLVFVTGSIENREYDKDGERRTISEIRAQQVGFLSGADGVGSGGRQNGQHGQRPPQQRQAHAAPAARNGWEHQQAALSEDIPF